MASPIAVSVELPAQRSSPISRSIRNAAIGHGIDMTKDDDRESIDTTACRSKGAFLGEDSHDNHGVSATACRSKGAFLCGDSQDNYGASETAKIQTEVVETSETLGCDMHASSERTSGAKVRRRSGGAQATKEFLLAAGICRPPRLVPAVSIDTARQVYEDSKRGRSLDRCTTDASLSKLCASALEQEETVSACSTRSGASSADVLSARSDRSSKTTRFCDSTAFGTSDCSHSLPPLRDAVTSVSHMSNPSRLLVPCGSSNAILSRAHCLSMASDVRVDVADRNRFSVSRTRLRDVVPTNEKILLRVVSGAGTTSYGGPDNRSLLTPRATAGVRKLPPRAPSQRRETSEEQVRYFSIGSTRSCELDSGTHNADESLLPGRASKQFLIQGMQI